MVPCALCQKPTSKADGECSGCGAVICDSLDCDRGGAPWGKHKPEDHRRELDD
jgi:predicted amidophosphoribosyltransferase